MKKICICKKADLDDAIGQVMSRVIGESVEIISIGDINGYSFLSARYTSRDELVEFLAKMSLTYTIGHVMVKSPYSGNIHFVLTESKDGQTNITWEMIERILNIVSIWRQKKQKMGIVFTKPW